MKKLRERYEDREETRLPEGNPEKEGIYLKIYGSALQVGQNRRNELTFEGWMAKKVEKNSIVRPMKA